MKRSEINGSVKEATRAFRRHGWTLPPKPRWDVTDFGLGNFRKYGLTVVNLAEQPEYCEKLMFARRGQITPRHYHAAKKEDIICRWGRLAIKLFPKKGARVRLQVNGEFRDIPAAKPLILKSGERITLTQKVPHQFWADSRYAIMGEVSTCNDDLHDNYFHDQRIGRFSVIDEDERPRVRLVSDRI